MKTLLLMSTLILLSGCWLDTDLPYRQHEVLMERAATLCDPKGGVYQWGAAGDFGLVKCYDLTVYDTFKQQQVLSQ